jgi:hypothetical protein
MSVSSSGVLAMSRGIFQRNQRLTWRDRIGTPINSVGELGFFSNLDLNHDETRLAVSGIVSPRQSFDIWIVDLVRGTSEPVTSDPDYEFDPEWSPDEQRIGFISNRIPGRYGAYSRASDGSGKDEPLIESESRWSGDSKEIFFLAPDSTLMAAHVDGGRWSTPEKLFRTDLTPGLQKVYAVRRDGKRFLMPMASGPPVAPTISVIVNWQSRLASREAGGPR